MNRCNMLWIKSVWLMKGLHESRTFWHRIFGLDSREANTYFSQLVISNFSHLVTPTRHLWPMLGRENKPVGKTRQDLHQREKRRGEGKKQAPTLSGPPEPCRGSQVGDDGHQPDTLYLWIRLKVRLHYTNLKLLFFMLLSIFYFVFQIFNFFATFSHCLLCSC